MRRVILIAVVASAFGEQSSFESGLESLKDHVSRLVLNGGTRGSGLANAHKNMVESFLADVGTKLDGDAKAVLLQVSDLLQQILGNLDGDRVEKQTLLDGLYEDFSTDVVDTSVRDTFAERATNLTTHETDHRNCRHDQHDSRVLRDSTCETFDIWMNSQGTDHHLLNCAFPGDVDSNANVDSWAALLLGGKNYFQMLDDNYDSHYNPCKTNFDNENALSATCDNKKRAFELYECNSLSQRTIMCDAEDAAYTTAKNAYENAVSSVTPLSAQRVNDAQMVTYLKCLVDNLRTVADATIDSMEAACLATKNADYSAYANTFLATPAQGTCPTVVTTANPYSPSAMGLTQAELDHLEMAAEQACST